MIISAAMILSDGAMSCLRYGMVMYEKPIFVVLSGEVVVAGKLWRYFPVEFDKLDRKSVV